VISLLTGKVVARDLERAVIDVGGVGYEVLMPMPDLAGLGAVGQQATVFVHTYVREDALRLYGFREATARQLFEQLIGVAGVGPKTALALLSGIDQGGFARAVEEHDVTRLTRVPGIGKKTAERLCLELRDKVAGAAAPARSPAEAVGHDLLSALEGLGYKRARAEEVARGLDDLVKEGTDLEVLVREALKRLQ